MAPNGGKRKRHDRNNSAQDDSRGRPSPHKPQNLNLAQQNQRHDRPGSSRNRGRGGHSDYAANNHRPDTASDEPGRPPSTSQPSEPTPRPSRQSTPQPARPMASQPASRSVPLQQRETSPAFEPPPYFSYDHLTDDLIESWDSRGRLHFIDSVAGCEDTDLLGEWLQELVQSVLAKRLDPRAAGQAFKAAVESRNPQSKLDLQTALVDIVSLGNESDWRPSLYNLFLTTTGIPPETWRNALDQDALIALGLVRGGRLFPATRAKKMTNLLYRQANYNLLREESEGYAKLITEYFNTAMSANALESAPTIAEDAFQRVKALIGSFDLDVGRVLDITLDVFANLLVRNFRFFVKYIRASAWWPEDIIPDGIAYESDNLGSLPGWALPGAADWGLGFEEAERVARDQPLKDVRDLKFWKRVKEFGLDAFSELSARRITNYDQVQELLAADPGAENKGKEIDSKGRDKDELKRRRINDAKKWMRETKTLPPLGNADAAQLLGFKLSFYASSARDETDVMPENLIFLTALLIKIGFVSLRDLYPHLCPSDEKMADVKERLAQEQSERDRLNRPGGAARNALAMAGGLDESTPAPSLPAVQAIKDASGKAASPKPDGATTPRPDADKDQLPEPPNQKILLLKSLLAIGALPEALFILGRFPWLADLVPEVSDHIHRILHHMLRKVYDPLRPLSERSGLSEQRRQIGSAVGLPKGSINQIPAPARITKRWANLDRPDMGDGFAYKFYWDEWAENIPVCQSVDDVFLLCGTLLNLTGVKIGQDPGLLLVFARLGKASLAEDRSPPNESRWIDLLKRLIVPALSLTNRNPGLVNEVYDLLKLFPTSLRYSIYTEWHFGLISRSSDMRRAFDYTRAETRDVLKRLSKTNARTMGKTLAKAAYGSPGIVLQTAISQMESYANLINVFVDCSRYFTYLGYDVLTWCLLNALGGASRNRVQADGMLTSPWLQALSTFAGAVFQKYTLCDPAPILLYIASELEQGDSTDLELFEQIITAMTGIKSDMTYNDAQVLAMAGGEVLQAQTILTMGDERHLNEKSSKRLMDSLTESGLASQLLIAVAQERQMYAYRSVARFAPLKVIGSNVDKIHQVLVQYLDTLRTNLASDVFYANIPDIAILIRDYYLSPEIAFMIGRGGLARRIADLDAARKLTQHDNATKANTDVVHANGDVAMTDIDTVQQTKETAPVKSYVDSLEAKPSAGIEEAHANHDMDVDKVAHTADVSTSNASAEIGNSWHPALNTLVKEMPDILGQDVAATMSVPFYVTFWALSLQDIVVNTVSYDQEMVLQTALQNKIKNDRADTSAAGVRERERKIKAVSELKERLAVEMKMQIGAYTQVRNRLNKEKEHWFQDFHARVDVLHTSLLQNCFLPRASVSSLDAHFSFMMLKFLHNNATPGFRTMHLTDRLLRKPQIVSLIFAGTLIESENFGRFLNEVLKELQTWHADKNAYEKGAFGVKRQLPGYARKIKADHTPETFLDYEDFRCLLWKWHSNLNGAFRQCFDSKEYMHIRNAIIVLKSIHHSFPMVNFMGQGMVEKLDTLGKTEERGDLKLAASSLLGNLKRREKTWIMPQAFRLNDASSAAAKASKSQSPAPSKPVEQDASMTAVQRPQSADSKASHAERGEVPTLQTTASSPLPQPHLDVIAPVLQPTGISSTNNEPPSSAVTEDGEIRDDRKSFASLATERLTTAATETSKPASSIQQPSPQRPGTNQAGGQIQILKRSQSNQNGELPRPRSSTPGASAQQPYPRVVENATRPTPPSPTPARSDLQIGLRPSSRTHDRQPDRDTQKSQPAKLSISDRTARSEKYPTAPRSRTPTPTRDEPGRSRDTENGRRSDRPNQLRAPESLVGVPFEPRSQPRESREHSSQTRPRGPADRADSRVASRYGERDRDSGALRTREAPARPDESQRERRTEDGRDAWNGSAGERLSQHALTGTNPARAALIEGVSRSAQQSQERPGAQSDSRQRDGNRPASPRSSQRDTRSRNDAGRRSPDPDGRAVTNQSARGAPETRGNGREVFPERVPAGPRSIRENNDNSGSRRPSHDAVPRRSTNEASGNRPELQSQSMLRHQEPSYGRLSAPSTPRQPALLQQQQQGEDSPSKPRASSGSQTSPQPQIPDNVHPSRLRHLHPIITKPAPKPTEPRSAGPVPNRESSGMGQSKEPPAGPSSAGGTRAQDRRFAGLNDTLLGGSDRGTAIKGRANRLLEEKMPPPAAPSASHAEPPSEGTFSRGPAGAPSGPAPLASRISRNTDNRGDQDRDDRRRGSRDVDVHREPARERGGLRDDDRRRDAGRQQSPERGMRDASGGGNDRRSGLDSRAYRDMASNQGTASLDDGRRRGGRVDDDRLRDLYRDDDRRGGGRHGPQDHAGRDGRDGRDGRKRRGDDVMPANQKRRRSGA